VKTAMIEHPVLHYPGIMAQTPQTRKLTTLLYAGTTKMPH
jgi:hypothetical protein